MRVDIEEVRRLIQRRDEINAVPFSEIEWYENGERVMPDKDKLDGWKYVGLTNIYFVECCIDGKS